MLRNRLTKRTKNCRPGQASLEYIVLITFMIGALIIFSKYIVRAMYGRMKGTGDSLGMGRIYDPHHTQECLFIDVSQRFPAYYTDPGNLATLVPEVPPRWVDAKAFYGSGAGCGSACFSEIPSRSTCYTCVTSIADEPRCRQ